MPARALQASRGVHANTAAVRAWVRAKAGLPATAKGCRRELSRFLLCLQARGLTLSACNADDCNANALASRAIELDTGEQIVSAH